MRICLLPATLLFITLPALAGSPLQGLKFEQQKQRVMKDVRARCKPAPGLADNNFANRILATEGNRLNVRAATIALERGDQKRYQDAIRRIICHD